MHNILHYLSLKLSLLVDFLVFAPFEPKCARPKRPHVIYGAELPLQESLNAVKVHFSNIRPWLGHFCLWRIHMFYFYLFSCRLLQVSTAWRALRCPPRVLPTLSGLCQGLPGGRIAFPAPLAAGANQVGGKHGGEGMGAAFFGRALCIPNFPIPFPFSPIPIPFFPFFLPNFSPLPDPFYAIFLIPSHFPHFPKFPPF